MALTIRLYTPSSWGGHQAPNSAKVDDGYVYKGPYPRDAPELSLAIWRSAWFAIWGDVAYAPHSVVHNTDVDAFSIRRPGITNTHTDAHENENNSTLCALDVLRAKGSLPSETWQAILYHFICRFIAQCADTSLSDVLIGAHGHPYGIGFETVGDVMYDDSMPTTLWDLVFPHKPPRIYWLSIQAVLDQAKPGFAAQLRDRVIPHLERVGSKVEHECLARARLALALLRCA